MTLNRKPRIAVIGDIMVDIDLHCSCERICQEGPWPVLKVLSRTERMGGAGNVAAMCIALGVDCLTLGNPELSRKQRVFVDGKLTGPRIDKDSTWVPLLADLEGFESSIRHFEPDAIIVSDHGKGVVTEWLLRSLSVLEFPVFIDPVRSTPFVGDVEAIAGGVHEFGNISYSECLITKRGHNGLDWFNDNENNGHLDSQCANCIDPLGAGDQLIATLAIRRVLGDSWKDAIETANIASGLQCERLGCVPVTSAELDVALSRIKFHR